MPGLLGEQRGGGLLGSGMIRQVRTPFGNPQPSPFMGMAMGGQGGAGGIDPRDAPGSGLSIWRELMRGLSQHGVGALATNNAGKVFSPANRALLGPAYQPQPKKKGK